MLDKAAIALGNQRLFEERGLGLEVGPDAEVSEWLEPADVERVLGQIEKAAALADLVLVNGHSHEPSNPVTDVPTWLPELAKACIDAGAHAYIGHGPHRLRGIEIYRDRPILYSLGNFIVHRDAPDPVPAATANGTSMGRGAVTTRMPPRRIPRRGCTARAGARARSSATRATS